jgi:hypothetical protein
MVEGRYAVVLLLGPDIPVIGCLRESKRLCIVSGLLCFKLSKKFDFACRLRGLPSASLDMIERWILELSSAMLWPGVKLRLIFLNQEIELRVSYQVFCFLRRLGKIKLI